MNKKPTLALFFTRGISLELWHEQGLFNREKLIYEAYLQGNYFDKIFWFTYGDEDAALAKKLHNKTLLDHRIIIKPMPSLFNWPLGKLVYSFLFPFFYYRTLKHVSIYKTNQMDGSWSAILAGWLYGKKVLLRTGYTLTEIETFLRRRSALRIRLYQYMEKIAYKYADIFTVSSKHSRDYILKCYNLDRKRLHIVANFINLERFTPRKGRKIKKRILYVGRLSPEKNIENLLLACCRCGFGIDFYGDGPLMADLKTLARRNRARVRFYGFTDNSMLPDIYTRYRYYALTSLSEGLPKTLLEAMACGCICIGTNVTGISEVITHKKNGILARKTDANSIQKAIKEAEKCPPNRIENNAVKFINENFELGSICRKEFRLLSKLMREQNGA